MSWTIAHRISQQLEMGNSSGYLKLLFLDLSNLMNLMNVIRFSLSIIYCLRYFYLIVSLLSIAILHSNSKRNVLVLYKPA